MTKLEQAAQALLDHWDTPIWKDVKPTADLMADLREALAEQAEQEPVAYISRGGLEELKAEGRTEIFAERDYECAETLPLYAAPVHTKDLTEKWIDPNDKSQQQYLPHIGEKVLFCCDGEVYYGHHTGGAFQKGHGITKSLFPTWDCMWMHLPTAFIAPDREKNK